MSRVKIDELQGLEVSVLWHTEGKGDEDLHVHHFQRMSKLKLREIGVENDQSIQCVLPATPLSYHGQLIRLSWCVRMRLYLEDGREIVSESPFYLVSDTQDVPCVASSSEEDVAENASKSTNGVDRQSRAAQTRSALASLRRD